MSIEDWRRKIDEIDRQLVQLLNERSREHLDAAGAGEPQPRLEIGRIKHKSGEPVYQPDRENQVLDAAVRANPGPLPDAAIRRLFERILDEARSVERSVMSGGDGKNQMSGQ